jgi:hypothetical protein
MNLFKKHTAVNQKNAKKALKKAAIKSSSKFLQAQHLLATILASGKPPKLVNKAISKITKDLCKCHDRTQMIMGSYELLFDKELNIDDEMDKVIENHYPLIMDAVTPKVPGSTFSEKDVDDKTEQRIAKSVAKALGVSLKKVRVSKTMASKNVFSKLNPQDFNSFEEFMDAVKAASKREDELAGKSGEEIISENVIRNTEAAIEEIKERAKASSSKSKTSSNGDAKPKTDA